MVHLLHCLTVRVALIFLSLNVKIFGLKVPGWKATINVINCVPDKYYDYVIL